MLFLNHGPHHKVLQVPQLEQVHSVDCRKDNEAIRHLEYFKFCNYNFQYTGYVVLFSPFTDLLTDTGIASQDIAILKHGLVSGRVGSNFQDTPPFSKVSSVFLVLSTSLRQTVQTCVNYHDSDKSFSLKHFF